MPYSQNVFDADIAAIMATERPSTILDVGAGAGKYGRMARKVLPDARLTACEPCEEWIAQFRLVLIYDEVIRTPATELFGRLPHDARFDLTIAGDCLMIMTKSEGLDCLHEWTIRSKRVIIVLPVEGWNAAAANAWERPRSVWDTGDFRACSQWDAKIEVRNATQAGWEHVVMMMVSLEGMG